MFSHRRRKISFAPKLTAPQSRLYIGASFEQLTICYALFTAELFFCVGKVFVDVADDQIAEVRAVQVDFLLFSPTVISLLISSSGNTHKRLISTERHFL